MFNNILSYPFNRFILVGATTTLVTYLIYIIFLFFFNYLLAYTVSFILGILLSYYLNSSIVFHSKMAIFKALLFSIIYVLQFLLGITFLYIIVKHLDFDKRIAPIVIVFITIPINYILNKRILKS